MDRKLLDLLVCPTTRQPLALLDSRTLSALNDAIGQGGVVRGDGSAQTEPVREALVTVDRALAYRVDDGIPVLLAEESIALDGIAGLSAA
ncbi:MAG TPA: Trm112 family protein [Lysobacter sp.]|nr:Trm112 family protein [Lysobacter sp.]